MTDRDEIFDELTERCDYVMVVEQIPPDQRAPDESHAYRQAIGVMLCDPTGSTLAIEVGVNEDGEPHAVARWIGRDGAPAAPTMFELEQSVLLHPTT